MTRSLVIIPMKDHWLDLTEPLIQQLWNQDPEQQILVLDNGSSQETLNELSLKNHRRLWWANVPNLNMHEMWNYALSMARGFKYAVFLNNDLEIGPDFVSGLTKPMEQRWPVACVSPNYDGRSLQVGYSNVVKDICAGRYDGTGGMAGFAFALRMSWVEDNNYKFPTDCQWWYGDNDLVLTLNQNQATILITGNTTCKHLDGGSKTTKDVWGGSVPPSAEADRRAFLAKWAKEQDHVTV